ncbi:MAG TPA: SH3 domain-containing protein [Cytophagales bacterium]|jgi:hypothetical protein|nr:SH3 domain-containing protein [Cytophagales bacterium]
MRNRFYYISIVLLAIFSFSNRIISKNLSLNKADSLFNLKIYTKAKLIYDSLYYKENLYSESMFLKMALIEEGLENYEKSIYYLSQYQSINNNESSEIKIQKIANNYDLEGYKKNDFDYLQNILKENRIIIIYSLLLLTLLIFIINIYRILKSKKAPTLVHTFYIISILFLCIININLPKSGIVYFENTFIMDKPSSGSNLYQIVKKGDKLKIVGEESVWYKIKVNKTEKYIRKKNIKIIN